MSVDDLELLFLGTGTSSALPSVGCLTSSHGCYCCKSTLDPTDAQGRKNVRRNTSALLRIPATVPGGRRKSLLIDAGKTFYQTALEHWPKKGLREIDALLITHAHADAILGLDDLRGWTLRGHIQPSIPIYCTQGTFHEIEKCFPYLTDIKKATGGGDVPAFEWRIFDENEPLEILGVRVLPLKVEHGVVFETNERRPYYCLGFVFDRKIAYLSDVSRVLEETWSKLEEECTLPDQGPWRENNDTTALLQNGVNGLSLQTNGSNKKASRPQLEVLVVDCLRIETFTSHFGLGEAIGTARRLGAKRTYLVGFAHATSHACWVNTCERFSRGDRTTLSVDPAVRLPLLPAEERWKAQAGTEVPGKEDWDMHANYALHAIESYEGQALGGLWVRPSCDGMTVSLNHGDVRDDEYDS